jgi:alanyl-tRNA synthetase
MFYWVGDPNEVPESFNDDNDLWVEIWNDVFMAYNKNKEGKYEKLTKQNVDTGMGLERALTSMNGLDDNYRTELFWPIILKIEELSGKKYEESEEVKKSMRIVADHLKAGVFMIADGVEPSNTERGYVLRRLIRRAVRQGHKMGIENNFTVEIAKVVQDLYMESYPEVLNENVLAELQKEEEHFRKTLEKGLREFEKNSEVNGKIAFDLFQTYGFPVEMFFEELKNKEIEYKEDEIKKEFEEELKKHQNLSRTASAGMFKGGLADTQEETMALHTTAHLMLAGLRKVLGEHVHQKGSNINGQRVRFDFSHGDKLTDEQKQAVEEYVNSAISAKIPVEMNEMTLDEAREQGAEGAFENKYGDRVKVYSIAGFSNEICGGPHVANTGDIKGVFKIKKEQSSSAGVRRIKAVLE